MHFGQKADRNLPIWITYCTYLLLYGIHLWADLDRDRCVGSSKPNQNDYVSFSVILVTHPKSYIETTDRYDQPVKMEVRTGAIVKNSGFFLAWAEPDKKNNIFCVSTILRRAYRKQFYPKPMVQMESRDSEDVPFTSLESL